MPSKDAKESIGPKIKEKIALNIANGENYPTLVYIGGSIKVSIGKTYLDVALKHRTCICKVWQMSRIPCDHACVAIRRIRLDISENFNEWFKFKC